MCYGAPPNLDSRKETKLKIAQVLYGMMRQPKEPSRQEIICNHSPKFSSREANKSSPQNSSSFAIPISTAAGY
ncbi:hypothetical protein VNO77_13226 [Canavalia gladiata]|uniref:Uncharacterized protein n=1 Tax=Canavalia gladiata TaxID=3824 RepID=A0AAN9LXP0_CANGL